MKLPVAVFRAIAEQYHITLPAFAHRYTSGIRIADGAHAEDDYLYLSPTLPVAFLNEALAASERCGNWLSALTLCTGRGASPQELIDLSEEVLNEPLFLVDPSMKRIAATRHISAADRFFNEIASQGYPTLDTYARLNEGHYYAPEYYTGELVRLRTSEEPSADVAMKGIRLKGKLAATALMLCQNSDWSEAKTELFALLVEQLARSLESPWVQTDERSEQYDFLLRDLLDGKSLSAEEIAARLRFTGRTDPCPCNAVFFTAEEVSNAKMGYLCRILDSVFPNSRPLIYRDGVFTLLPSHEDSYGEAMDRLEQFCERTDCICGVSSQVTSLAQLEDAYHQALDTVKLGRELNADGMWFPLSGTNERGRTFFHGIYAPYRALRLFGESRPLESLCRRELLELKNADEKNGTDNLRILYHFLCGHMNYTEAARRLFMHRNSVFYRIERICDLMGVREIDTALENGLRFSYMVLDVMRLSEFSTNQAVKIAQ